MKLSLPIAAALAAIATSVSDVRPLNAAQPCGGPFRQCAWAVGAWCERDPDGQQRIHYWDASSRVMVFERCVGGLFEANGQPDPFKTGEVTTGSRRKSGRALSIPRSEVHYPTNDKLRR